MSKYMNNNDLQFFQKKIKILKSVLGQSTVRMARVYF